jgi:pantetheine-phosphate adenylyltransferase
MVNKKEGVAIYAGSFDPATHGHEWVMNKVSNLFGKGYVAIGINPGKNQGRFPIPEREQMLKEIAVKQFPNLIVTSFAGLYAVDFAEMMGAKYLVRGARNGVDFDGESEIKHINSKINPNIETIIFVPPKKLLQVSSSSVMGLIGYEGWKDEVGKMVSGSVFKHIESMQSEKDRQVLDGKWQSLWERLGAKGNREAVFDNLMKQYAESGRVYHTSSHLKTCLNELMLAKHLAEDSEVLETAIWFHDAIQKSNKKNSLGTKFDDEGESAELAVKVLTQDMGLGREFADKVASIILATKHNAVPQSQDAKLMADIDLAIFGRSSRIFKIYEKNIRDEFEWVPDELFVKRRKGVLEQFVDRKRIYQTDFFHDRYGRKAKINLKNSINKLSNLKN